MRHDKGENRIEHRTPWCELRTSYRHQTLRPKVSFGSIAPGSCERQLRRCPLYPKAEEARSIRGAVICPCELMLARSTSFPRSTCWTATRCRYF